MNQIDKKLFHVHDLLTSLAHLMSSQEIDIIYTALSEMHDILWLLNKEQETNNETN